MNSAKSLFAQQSGGSKWRNYDMAINRLMCRKDEEYKFIFPDEAYEGATDTPIFACKFAHVEGYQHILALANEDGKIAIHNTDTKEPRYGGSAHNNAIFDLAWMPKGMKLVSASGDHTAALFDINNGDIMLERVFHGHTRSLKSVTCRMNDSAVFATGGRDGKIIIWDARVTKSDIVCLPDVCLPWTHHHPSQITKVKTKSGKFQDVVSGSSSITGLVFQDYYTLISCGAGDGLIKVWDMRKTYYAANRAPIPKYTLSYAGATWRNGFSNLLLNSAGTKLYANCLDNIIYCYNVATYNPEPIMQYIGHKNSTFYVKSSLSEDEMYLFSGSSDNNAYIWNTAKSHPIVQLEGHEAEVTCVAWCEKGNTVLVTCSDDLRHKIWRVGPETVPTDLAGEYSSHCSKLRHSAAIAPLTKRKRMLDIDENLYPFETSRINAEKFRTRLCRCFHPGCTKRYDEEYMMIVRNRDMAMEASKSKKIKAEPKRKRKSLTCVDQNIPSTSSNLYSDAQDFLCSAKRLKVDSDSDSSSDNVLISNLPNFVVDGSTPHINTSPIKKREKDWLTKLRLERMPTGQLQELSRPSASKMPKTDCKSPAGKASKGADSLSSRSTQSPLLKFFKVRNSPSQQCTAKSPNLVSSSPKQKSSQ